MMAETRPTLIPIPREIRRALGLSGDCQGHFDIKSKNLPRFVVYNSEGLRMGTATHFDSKWHYSDETILRRH